MKRIIDISIFFRMLSVILILLVSSACSSYPHQAWLEDDSDKGIADARLKTIILALENKDNKAIKAMFSKEAKAEDNNLDGEIQYLLDTYKGKMTSSDSNGDPSSEENLDGGDKKLTIKCDYTVTTNKETYSLFFVEKMNTANANEDGVYMLRLLKKSDVEYSSGIKSGAFSSAMLKSEDYFSGIKWLLEHDETERLEKLFSNKVINVSNSLDRDTLKAIDLFQGHMTSSKEISSLVKTEGDTIITTGYYEVTTDVNTYLIYFVHKRNEVDENEDGIYTLQIMKKADENSTIKFIDKPGVFVQ